MSSNTAYLWVPTGGSPTGDIRAKVQDHAFTGSSCSNITISGIDFFATTVNFTNSSNIRVENGDFNYPSCTKRMLGVTNAAPLTTNFNGGSSNVFYNNTMSYAETHAIYMNGSSNLIDNCRFEYIDWSCTDLPNLMSTVYMRGTNPTFRRNYSYWSGASEFLDLNKTPFVELNDISEIGYVQNDGAMIQITVTVQSGSDVGYNWFHDSFKYGSRFDAVNLPDSPTGSNGLMHHNVGYNIKTTLMFKGDDHQCISNTAFDAGNAGTYWVDYVYRRRTDAATRGLSYETQHSGTLAPESWSSTGFTETSIAPIDSDFESATSRILAEGIDQLFIRLEIKSSE